MPKLDERPWTVIRVPWAIHKEIAEVALTERVSMLEAFSVWLERIREGNASKSKINA